MRLACLRLISGLGQLAMNEIRDDACGSFHRGGCYAETVTVNPFRGNFFVVVNPVPASLDGNLCVLG